MTGIEVTIRTAGRQRTFDGLKAAVPYIHDLIERGAAFCLNMRRLQSRRKELQIERNANERARQLGIKEARRIKSEACYKLR